MKRIFLAALLAMPAACESVPVATPAPVSAATPTTPFQSVRVTVANVEIPVTFTCLSSEKYRTDAISPAREHVRQLILRAS